VQRQQRRSDRIQWPSANPCPRVTQRLLAVKRTCRHWGPGCAKMAFACWLGDAESLDQVNDRRNLTVCDMSAPLAQHGRPSPSPPWGAHVRHQYHYILGSNEHIIVPVTNSATLPGPSDLLDVFHCNGTPRAILHPCSKAERRRREDHLVSSRHPRTKSSPPHYGA
jgi:hypothetical protein